MISEIIRRLEIERDKAEAEFNATEHPYWMARYCARKNAFDKAIEIIRKVQEGERHGEERVCSLCNGTENILPEREPDSE